MSIIKENIELNGVEYDKTYSDDGYYIERDGIKYSEAIDPIGFGREYIETDEFIDPENHHNDNATEEDYLLALEKLGVSE